MTDLEQEPFPPPGVDLSRPSIARIYDYYLGGDTNWEIDRQFAERVLENYPILRPVARANRRFLHRAVRHLTQVGIRQFIDIGSGVPTMGHAHEIADQVAPGEVRVAYVDYEPVAVAHSRTLLREHGDEDRHTVIHADMRAPDRLWEKIADSGVIDFTQPVALLLIAVLHIRQPPADPSQGSADLGPSLVARYRELLPPNSYLGISHITDQGVPDDFASMLVDLKAMYDKSGNPIIFRDRSQITDFFGDFTIIDPGVTWTPLWHPELASDNDIETCLRDPSRSIALAGVARKSS
ncbi:SAM-dependent methyltransferase [Amycolatopsis sp. NPDC051102]|uniref:SAM-dependent methyltransferase n=1 Tax=Amycolatopsis sp. NPDC051102 TaxID=3155163 RepID=UPI00341F1170